MTTPPAANARRASSRGAATATARARSEARGRLLVFLVGHGQKRYVAELFERADVRRDDSKPGALVDPARPLVELRHVQQDVPRLEAGSCELELGQEEVAPEPAAGEVGAQAEAVVEVRRLRLEVVEPDQIAVFVESPEVPLGVEDLLDVTVVEVVRRWIPPGRKLRAGLRRGRFDADVHLTYRGVSAAGRSALRYSTS